MKFAEIQELMKQFEQSDTRELKIDDGDFHLYLSKNKAQKEKPAQAGEKGGKAEPQAEPGVKTIASPLVGTVYLQAKPGADPYVGVGDRVKKGQTVCVIEAMKMMTEIKSDYSGVITAINVGNGELVEVTQPLFTLRED